MGSAFRTRVLRSLRLSLPLLAACAVVLAVPTANAATSPGLGMASTFSILASTYTNTAAGTTINGDVGYTTGPVVKPIISGTFHVADGTYNQAGIDQNTALGALASQPCTFDFPNGAIDLSTAPNGGTAGTFPPGVYCTHTAGAASVGTAGIILTGSGTHIFRINGALTSVVNSAVTVAGGASPCDAFWTPIAATTLGANSTFLGTDIDASGITIGSTVTWTGRALAFGGTVSTDVDTINTVPACAAFPPAAPAVLAGPRFTG
jgi:Ice-binding-like